MFLLLVDREKTIDAWLDLKDCKPKNQFQSESDIHGLIFDFVES
jgi:hypothetical protein